MDGLNEGFQLADRYVLTRPLRSGGNAVLWQALDQRSGAAVALKFNLSGSVDELTTEFENLQTLSHPAIVVAQELVTNGGFCCLVLDLVDGIELSQYMGAEPSVWLPMLQQAVHALVHAHRQGVVHGDLKLENMLVTATGDLRLIDFGGRPGATVSDDIRALAVVMTELSTGLRPPEVQPGQMSGALEDLVADMRANRIELDAVAARIDAVLNDDMKPGETEQFETIQPVARQVSSDRSRPPSGGGQSSRLWWWLTAMAAVSVLVVAVFLLAPRILTGVDRPVASVDRVDEVEERLDDLRRQTQQQSAAIDEKWLLLEKMEVASWANLRAERAVALLQKGEQLASELDNVGALRAFAASGELLDALIAQAPGIAADRLAAGWQAYRAGDAETAAEHFRVVLAIEPDHDDVRAALQRTDILEEITRLSRLARQLEDDGDLNGALAAMNDALNIDASNVEFQQEVARLQSQVAATGFQATMSSVYNALRAKNYKGARTAIARASALRSGAPELKDAMIQIELGEREARIAQLRAHAIAAEAAEDWELAIDLYSELLQIDSALVLAQQGRDRSRRLASLTVRAEGLLESSLTTNDARRKADALLQQIASVNARAPSLQLLARKLTDAVALSRQPVTVQFRSDNLTDVQINRVGRLGLFESHELKLMPGLYVVVGKRTGYRDVREELVVESGQEYTSMTIRCEEQI